MSSLSPSMAPDHAAKRPSPWKKVEVQDDFLLGLTEPGFQDLEVLDASDIALLGDDVQSLIKTADEAAAHSKGGTEHQAEAGTTRPKKKKKTKKAIKSDGKDKHQHSMSNFGDLQARVSALEAENAQLRHATEAGAHAHATTPPQETATPLHEDMSAWDDYGLHELVINSLAKLRFTAPTDIQHECLPAAIIGNADIVGAAQTGSGKTLAFGLPIINYLVNEAQARADEANQASVEVSGELPAGTDAEGDSRAALRALILCPTRELALQVSQHISAVAKPLCIRVAAIVGGLSPQKQARLLRYCPPIVVATPGRLWDLIRSGESHLANLRHLAFLVLDEADRMVARGHFEELSHILTHIPRRRDVLLRRRKSGATGGAAADPGSVVVDTAGVVRTTAGGEGDSVVTQQATLAGTLRTYVFSATLMLADSLKVRLQRGKGGSKGSGAGATLESLMERLEFRGKPKVADLTAERKIATKVVEAYLSCTQEERDDLLYYLLCMHPGRTLVFLNTISSVRRVSAILKTLGVNTQVLHAQQQQRQRLKALERFRRESAAVLVATDVAARGLDIPDVAVVVQYQLPPTADTYIHRAGRTARAGAEGVCVSLVVPGEAARFAALHAALERPAPQEFPVDPAMIKDAHRRVRLAQRIDELERADSKDAADVRWMQRNAAAMGVDLDEAAEAKQHKGQKQQGTSDLKLAKALREELQAMLADPLRHRMNSKFFTGGTSQAVARSLGTVAHQAEADAGTRSNTEDGQDCVVGAEAMRASVAEAERVVQRRLAPPDGSAGIGASAGAVGKKKRKQMTLAQHQEIALQNAIATKRLKKAGRKARGGGVVTARDPNGQMAIAAIRAIGKQ